MKPYCELLLGDSPVIMGVQLRPFSLGAYVHLFNEKCFVLSDKVSFLPNINVNKPTAEEKQAVKNWCAFALSELGKGILICSVSFERYKELQFAPLEKEKIYDEWSEVIKTLVAQDKFSLHESINDFHKYLVAGKEPPFFRRYQQKTATPMPGGGGQIENWFVPIVVKLCSVMGLTENEIYNQPLQKTFYDYYAIEQQDGNGTFANDAYIELVEKWKASQ